MLWYGDVNGSFIPTSKEPGTSVSLKQEGFITIPSFSEFSLPVKIKKGNEIGAISLGLYYPEEFFEILVWNWKMEVKISLIQLVTGCSDWLWCAIDPMNLKDSETMLTIHLRSLDLSGLKENAVFRIYEHTEFADKLAQEIPGVILEIPEIRSFPTGIEESQNTYSIQVYPNPFYDITGIDFTLPQEYFVKADLYDVIGKPVKAISGQQFPAGPNRIIFNRGDLTPGIYFLRMDLRNSNHSVSKMIKVVVSN